MEQPLPGTDVPPEKRIRHAKAAAFTAKMFAARAELYNAFSSNLAPVIENYGAYRVQSNGQLLFASRAAADRYNSTGAVLGAAAKNVENLDQERNWIQSDQQQRWEKLVTGQ